MGSAARNLESSMNCGGEGDKGGEMADGKWKMEDGQDAEALLVDLCPGLSTFRAFGPSERA